MKFILETENRSWTVTENDVYEVVVEQVYGEDTRNVSKEVHEIAVGAECFCEDPWSEVFEEIKFNIIPEELEDRYVRYRVQD